ncbi:MAG: DNA polymerase III subunit delta [uncultured Campylobacterales bacterium]|uniref:DNA polymerase III subunit delta n=1 Tax=uncultured Campylobacterales bacterium TaxID=352960 RepID=A0A6S6SYP9_9BACT|nr:MAG: DNA polymerase III subunit delta [uncultured Campylobacterales bacterium]
MRSAIILTNNFSKAKEELLTGIDPNFVKIYEEDAFLVEHSKQVIKEAYIKEKETKYIVLIAKSYNQYAQNSLLKIIEEPPGNVEFFVFIENISAILPTIRSRMMIQKFFYEVEDEDIGLEISNLDLETIYAYVKKNSYIKPNELKVILETIFQKAIRSGVTFNEQELDSFNNLFKLINLYGSPFNILLKVLMMIYQKRG